MQHKLADCLTTKIAGAAILSALLLTQPMAAAAAEEVILPKPGNALFSSKAGPITVIEPHLSTAAKPVEVTYQGYRATAALDAAFGSAWRKPDALLGFKATDGYFSMIPAQRFLKYEAHLVYAKVGSTSFTVDNHMQGERDVPLGPWYLVWNNKKSPALLSQGADGWPYQTEKMMLVDRAALKKLEPASTEKPFRAGLDLTKNYCLACHQINGIGGAKFPIDLAQRVKDHSYESFSQWVLNPASVKPGTSMPPLAYSKPAAEREQYARQIYDYLKLMSGK